jgi:hypothetical protein
MLVWKIHGKKKIIFQDIQFKDHGKLSSRVLAHFAWYSCWRNNFEWILPSGYNYLKIITILERFQELS